MRIPPRLAAALALAAGLPTGSAAAQEDVRGILFAAGVTAKGDALLEPVATLTEGGYIAPPADPDSPAGDAFEARWMNAGRRYDVLSRGERVGGVTVREPARMGCFGLSVYGALAVRGRLPGEWRGLAGEGLPEQPGAPWLREATAGERRDLDRMAAALFQAHGIDAAARSRGDTAVAALVVHPNARPLLVGTYALVEEGGVLRQAALMVVAEEGEAGYRPAYTWFHEAMDAEVESRRVVDAADLDGDGMPELVIRNGYYESWDFIILKRGEHGWVTVYHGGGSGC